VPASSSPDWTAIVGIVVAGVVGAGLGYLAAWRSDIRKFRHERELKASNDLQARLDDVAVALDNLGDACAAMRSEVLQYLGDDRVIPSWRAADDAYQHTRALIERLGMRPHADLKLVEEANGAARAMLEAIRLVDEAIINHRARRPDADSDAVSGVADAIERGYARRRAFENLARSVVGRLIGTEPAGMIIAAATRSGHPRRAEVPRSERESSAR
jgi:hypothetical protein